MPSLTYSASITVAATPAEVYALVSDVSRIGESSPACQGITWDEGATGVAGDQFAGHNEVAGREWTPRNEVTVADGTSFGWTTGPHISTWTYSVAEGDEAGTTVLTESWEFPESGQEIMRGMFGERAEMIIAGSPANTQASVDATLAAMKQILESASV